MIAMLVAYDEDGGVFATLDHVWSYAPDGTVLGMVDFEAYEDEGLPLTQVWYVEQAGPAFEGQPGAYLCTGSTQHAAPNAPGTPIPADGTPSVAAADASGPCPGGEWRLPAKGSGTWPEFLGPRALDFRVERAGGRITQLVHKRSGRIRRRALVLAAIARRIADAEGQPAFIADIVGGPGRPLDIDDDGDTRPWRPPVDDEEQPGPRVRLIRRRPLEVRSDDSG